MWSRSLSHSGNSGYVAPTAPCRPSSLFRGARSVLFPAGLRELVMTPIDTPKITPARVSAAPPQRDTPFGTITPRRPPWPGEADRASPRTPASGVAQAPEATT